MKTNYTEKLKHELVKRYYGGESVSTICLQTGIPRSTFYTWIKPYKVIGTASSYEVSAANFAKQKSHMDKLESMIKVLQSVNCTATAPRRIKLQELTKLYGQYSVRTLCDSLNVPRGTFYNHIYRNKGDNTSYVARREMLSIEIKKVYDESNQVYGAKKIRAVLLNRGINTSNAMVLELMQAMNLKSIRSETKRKYRNYLAKNKKDHLKLNFTVKEPNQVWVSDTTYIKVCGQKRYICVVLDLYARKVIAYKISPNHSTQLITSTFKNAYKTRQPNGDLIFHSDRGAQYTSFAFRSLLNTLHIKQSFSPTRSPYHNSVMESFFSGFKNEELYRVNYRSIRDFYQHVDKSIHKYNNERPHATLKYTTPNAYEKAFFDKKSK